MPQDAQPDSNGTPPPTAGSAYADRLTRLSGRWWKQALDVQRPYRHNIERLALGTALDIGCGIGRNLAYLDDGSVGIDHNADSIGVARSRGLDAWTTEEFFRTPQVAVEGRYDGLLAAHLVEHMPFEQGVEVLASYLPFLRAGARCVLICPQERGYASDDTHVLFADFAVLRRVSERLGLVPEREYSFPFPRPVGKVFTYNEFVHVARKP